MLAIDEFAELLQELIDADCLESREAGITRQVIDRGVGSLSEKQRYVFERYVLGDFTVESCTRCGHAIPWSEMFEAHDNGGYCSWCAHQRSKMLADRW